MAMISSIRAGTPSMCTGIMALVFEVILRSRSLGSMFKDLSTSVRIGTAPASTTDSMVATNVKDCVITSSPFWIPRAVNATRRAAEPDETPSAYLQPMYLQIASSNSCVTKIFFRFSLNP